MEKVMCLKCKDIGFTASPQYTLCHCGSHLTVISDELFSVRLDGLLRTIREKKEVHVRTVALDERFSKLEGIKAEVEEYESVAYLS